MMLRAILLKVRASGVLVAAACVLTIVVAVSAERPQDEILLTEIERLAVADLRSWPLLVHAGDHRWYQPLEVYPAAILRRYGISADAARRTPSLLAAVLTIVTTYLLGVRLGRRWVGAWAAALLAASPVFLDQASVAGAGLLMMPALTLWLVCVTEYVRHPLAWLPAAGGAALAMAVYTQPQGVLAAVVFFGLGAAYLLIARRDYAAVGMAAAGSLVVLVPLAVWLLRFPDAYPDTFGRWAIHAAHVRNPWEGLVAFSRWHVMARRVGSYWDYLNPSFLFLSGQVFSLGLLALIPVGLWSRAAWSTPLAYKTAAAGLLAAPLAAVMLDAPRSASLALPLVLFGALVGASGLWTLLSATRLRFRVGGVLALLAIAAQLTLATK